MTRARSSGWAATSPIRAASSRAPSRALARLPGARASSRVSPNYVTAPVGCARRAARLRQRRRRARARRWRRARCSRACSRSSAASAAGAIPRARATRRGRSTSICYYTAAVASACRELDGAASAHARARVRAAAAGGRRAGDRRSPAAGSRAPISARGARPAHRAHPHATALTEPARPWTSRSAATSSSKGPIGAGKTSLARAARRAPATPTCCSSSPRTTRSSRASTTTWRASRCRRSSRSCSSASTSCAASAQLDMFRQPTVADFLLDKDPLFARLNLSDDEYALYEKVYPHLKPQTAAPDLVIYLQAPVETLVERVRRRGVELRAVDPGRVPRAARRRVLAASSTSTTRRRCSSSTASGSTSSTIPAHLKLLLARIAAMRGAARVLQPRPGADGAPARWTIVRTAAELVAAPRRREAASRSCRRWATCTTGTSR